MSSLNLLRYKHYIATNAWLLVTLCVVVIVLGGAVAFTGVATPSVLGGTPVEEPRERVIHTGSVEQSVSVEVVDDTEAFTAGQRLTDRSLYPTENAADPL